MNAKFLRLARDLNRARERHGAALDALAAAEAEQAAANKAVREAEQRFHEHAASLAAAAGVDE